MANQKRKKERANKRLFSIIALSIILLVFFSTFFYSGALETAFSFQPNLSNVQGGLEVHFVDVGQGDAILARLPNGHTMLVDSGSSLKKNDLFTYIDKVFFKTNGHKYFDYVVLTHPDEDHAGNIYDILCTYEVKNFYRPLVLCENESSEYNVLLEDSAFYKKIIDKANTLSNTNKMSVRLGEVDAYIEDSEYAEFLGPIKKYYTNTNDYSIVMKLKYNEESVLLTGDSEFENLRTEIDSMDISILKVSHHGSKQSLLDIADDENPSDIDIYDNLLNMIQPKYAVISVGEYNSYGHPDICTLKALQKYMVDSDTSLYDNTFVTAECGVVVFNIDSSGDITNKALGKIDKYCYIDWNMIAGISIAVISIVLVWEIVKYYKVKSDIK